MELSKTKTLNKISDYYTKKLKTEKLFERPNLKVKRIEKLKEVIKKLKQLKPDKSDHTIHTRASQLLMQANKFKGDTRGKILHSEQLHRSFSMFTVHNEQDYNENPSFSSFKDQAAFITEDQQKSSDDNGDEDEE